MEEAVSFGIWVHKQRRALELSRQAFANQVGCAEITLRRIEEGTLKPSKELANILLEKLGIPETERARWISFARGLSSFPLSSTPFSNKPITNLPALLTSFIGREKEQSDLISLIAKYRLVTLTGSGGVGKTRLSIKVGGQVLETYANGVWLVELAPILDPLLVPRTTAIAIGLRDEPQRPVIDMLSDYLREKKILLILDSCEHLLGACAKLVDKLLKNCPNLKILVTSREALGIMGEATYRVPSMGLPDRQQLFDTFRSFESVKLFEERAQLVQVDFSLTLENASSVAQICHHLDGIPLAIELAAAKVGTFSTEQIAKQLDDRFSLLTEGNHTALPRHQTLRSSMDWSWGLLTESEQIFMRQLSVFAGGWSLEATHAVCNGDVLQLTNSLLKKSLLVIDQEIGRYHFHETIHQYAHEKLVGSGESNLLRDRHLEYFLKLAETAESHLIGPEQVEWLPLLDADYENLRLAFEWGLSKESAEPVLNLCRALGWFWEIRCYWMEGLNYSIKALAKPLQVANMKAKIARTRALFTRVLLEKQLGNSIEKILSLAESSLALALETSDRRDIAIAKYFLADALFQRGEEKERAFSLQEQSFAEFQELNEAFWQAFSFLYQTEFPQGQAKLNFHDKILHSIDLARKAGERLTLADALTDYANWLFKVGHVNEAKKYAEESEHLYQQIGAENISLNPFLFAEIAWSKGDTQKAKSMYMELYQRFSLLGEKGFRSNSIGKLGILAMEEGDLDHARTYFEEALMLERAAGWKPWEAFYLAELGNLLYQQGNFEEFRHNIKESLSLRNYFPEYHKTYILMTILGSLYSQKPESSAMLLGIIDKHEGDFDLVRTPVEKRYCRNAEAHAREILRNPAFETAFALGQSMSLDEGLDIALKIVEEM